MKKPVNTPWFEFDTTSKKTEQRAGDCVVRSISLATGKSWEEVYDALCALGRKMYRMPNDKAVYSKYLNSLGWTKMAAPRKEDNHKFLAHEFAKMTKSPTIAHVGAHHLSCFINNKIHDIWDCGNYSVGNYWVKE
jgi:hypothetical protein